MNVRRILVSAGMAAATAALAVAPAFAAAAPAGGPPRNEETLDFRPNPARSGGSVEVTTFHCGDSQFAWVDTDSIRDANRVKLTRGFGDRTLTGRLHLPDETRPGRHDITGRCENGSELRGVLEVVPGRGAHAGFGIDQNNTTHAVAGSVLIAGAGLGGAFLLRQRRARQA
ncbi:hypothetical protein ACIQNU_26630 [Streptomyces sp. NPDC091292]|uniref:hypothetical protein n=1 Tax=Streptomyces sp. NPDC091292 TaxID=3365991 RepID=UPI0038198D87